MRPAGLATCRAHERDRYIRDRYACPPYQYKDENLIQGAHGLRLPSPEEIEVLHGYRRGHTLTAMKGGEAKDQPAAFYALRKCLLGNTYHAEVVAWLLGHFAAAAGYLAEPASVEEIRSRTLQENPLRREPIRGNSRGLSDDQVVVWDLMRGADHKGSDVRISSGALSNPSTWPRAGIPSNIWRWKVALALQWKQPGHINVLEAVAIVAAMRWRLRRCSSFRKRVFHLADSQVCIGVFTKRRSSSKAMDRVVRRMNALELAAGIIPIYGYVRTDDNPADAPSRYKKTKKCRRG